LVPHQSGDAGTGAAGTERFTLERTTHQVAAKEVTCEL